MYTKSILSCLLLGLCATLHMAAQSTIDWVRTPIRFPTTLMGNTSPVSMPTVPATNIKIVA